MGKSRDAKKSIKKPPAKTAKEKKAEKRLKNLKEVIDDIVGFKKD